MNAKHTPGPWRMSDCGEWSASHDGYGASSYIGVKDQAGTVVAIAVAHDPEPFGSDPDPEANARLIAAAPDLLTMLVEAANFIQPYSTGQDLLERIEATIAKATWEQ